MSGVGESLPIKRCKTCMEKKPATTEFFGPSKKCLFAVRAVCRICVKQAEKEKRRTCGYNNLSGLTAKPCSRCGVTKPLEAFALQAGRKDGRQSGCKACKSDAHKERCAANPAFSKEASARFRALNPESVRKTKRRYHSANLDKHCAHAALRRARKKAVGGSYTAEEFAAKLKAYEGRCHWCGKVIEKNLHRDHLIPLSKGGRNDLANIVPSCAPCNWSKNDKMPWEFQSGRLF